MPLNKGIRVLITRPTRCDIRPFGAEDSRVESVEPGEVYEIVEDAFQNLITSNGCVVTDKPVKNRFVVEEVLPDPVVEVVPVVEIPAVEEEVPAVEEVVPPVVPPTEGPF